MFPQISSFTVAPNYEILFYNCDIYEVVNILDFWDGTVPLSSVVRVLENFAVGGESNGIRDVEILF